MTTNSRLNCWLARAEMVLSRRTQTVYLSLLVADIRYRLLGVRSRWLLNYIEATSKVQR